MTKREVIRIHKSKKNRQHNDQKGDLWILITSLLVIVLSVLLRFMDSDYLPFGHCVVCSSSIYGFWLPPFWSLCCLCKAHNGTASFDFERSWWRLFQKRVVCTKFDIYVLIIFTCNQFLITVKKEWCFYFCYFVLSVLLRFTDSDYPFGIFWPLCCLFFFDLWILITSLWYLQTLLDILREKSK
jgi:predicted nucleic acid-binding Zn ribbon protein